MDDGAGCSRSGRCDARQHTPESSRFGVWAAARFCCPNPAESCPIPPNPRSGQRGRIVSNRR